MVRNPLSVLASWNSVDLPVGRGRLPAGERLSPDLALQLTGGASLLERQVRILAWFFAHFRSALPDERVLRYEDVVASQGALLRERAGLSGTYDQHLADRNASPNYSGAGIRAWSGALLDRADCWAPWYEASDIARLAERLEGGGRR